MIIHRFKDSEEEKCYIDSFKNNEKLIVLNVFRKRIFQFDKFKIELKKYYINEINYKNYTVKELISSDSKEEIKIWIDLNGYRCSDILINDLYKTYTTILNIKMKD